MKFTATNLIVTAVFTFCSTSILSHTPSQVQNQIKRVVDEALPPVMAMHGIPGMAIGIIVGDKSFVFNYGFASTESKKPITDDTLFEVGSISKTLTATLASVAQTEGYLSLQDKTSKHLPLLKDTKFGEVSLVHLGTHTPGGLPLQAPENIQSTDQLMKYFKHWQPAYPTGTYRTYANLGIGMLGFVTAKSMGQDFTVLMEQRLLPALGMSRTFINVPATHLADYAQGYTRDDKPVRMAIGLLSSEAYGIKTTAIDMVRFMRANMNLVKLDEKLQRAITATHTGYFKVGNMTQDLIWEQYPYPTKLATLLEGNSPAMIFDATAVTVVTPPQKPRGDVWINKTGSTNGFSAYVAFVPNMRLGIVILANKTYPITERVTTAHRILMGLVGD